MDTKRGRKAALSTGAALGATVVFAPGAQAATFEVNSLADPGDGTCDGAECTLREAVEAAEGAAGEDTITFASSLSGTIELTAGEIEISEAVQIQGPGADALAIDGGGEGRIFYVAAGYDESVGISGLAMQGGDAAGPGGAIFHDGGVLTLADSVLRNNRAEHSGGAIASGPDTTLTITDTAIRNNYGHYQGGGIALYAAEATITGSVLSGNAAKYSPDSQEPGPPVTWGGGIGAYYSPLTVEDTRIAGNFAKYGGGIHSEELDDPELNATVISGSEIERNIGKYRGGGINIDETGALTTIADTTIAENSAFSRGGGINVQRGKYEGLVEVTRSTIVDNTAGGFGGGVAVYENDMPVAIEQTTIAGNSAQADGGGLDARLIGEGAQLEISRSTIAYNEAAGAGGGVQFDGETSARVSDSTVSGNTANEVGGGIAVGYAEGSGFEVENTTVADNTAYAGRDEERTAAGGGIYADAPLTLSSSVVADNGTGGDLGAYIGIDVDPTVGFSLIEDPGGTPFTADPAGSNLTGVDPQLGPLADNGGPTETHLPADSSPLIDAGIANGLATDQRGDPRTVDRSQPNASGSDGTDVGSVELGPPPPTPETVNCQGNELTAIDGTEGDDDIVGSNEADAIFGLGGNDRLEGVIGPDCVNGGPGDDIVKGQGGEDLLSAGEGDDKVIGDGGKDRLDGEDGDDRMRGDEGKDRVNGGEGADRLRGGPGRDRHKGGPDADRINSVDNKRDKVNCGSGEDRAVVDGKDQVSSNCESVVEVPAN